MRRLVRIVVRDLLIAALTDRVSIAMIAVRLGALVWWLVAPVVDGRLRTQGNAGCAPSPPAVWAPPPNTTQLMPDAAPASAGFAIASSTPGATGASNDPCALIVSGARSKKHGTGSAANRQKPKRGAPCRLRLGRAGSSSSRARIVAGGW